MDRLAGRPEGHCAQIERGAFSRFETQTVADYARVLGASPGWLAFGEGAAPSAAEVRAAVERARRARDPNAIAPATEVVLDPEHAQAPAQDEVPAFEVDTPRTTSRRSSRRSAALGG